MLFCHLKGRRVGNAESEIETIPAHGSQDKIWIEKRVKTQSHHEMPL
jgi:hypothetical protein